MYKLTHYEYVIRLSDNAMIPLDDTNRDYVEYQGWLAEDVVPVNICAAADPIIYEKTISPQQNMPVAGNPVFIEFCALPNVTFDVLIDGVVHTITTDDDGIVQVEYTPLDVGVYIIKGVIGSPLEAVAAKIEAV